ncbi:methionyl-tRNA formyltransferase [Flavobacteriaceae bacterium MAR_2009_75]|nr:methionyl-tRNA formyltransferase [Flavobacteriaceae bacterium MAR_2009_75]
MKDLRIIFMGTPEFATTILKRLVEENYTIAGVITAPDRPAGRGRKLQESDVKKYASDQGLRVLQPTNLKSEEFLAELKSLEANLQIVVAFRMLPKVVWAMPDYGTFNLHASLLPDYRGAAPINWAIINGETETGVTTFFIDEKIDTGEIILQERTTIDSEDNAGILHDKLMHLGAELVLKTVKQIASGNIETQKQVTSEPVKEAFKIHKDTCKIDWTQSLETIHNHIRGLSPYPAAWTNFINGKDEMSLKIYKSTTEKDDHNFAIGHVLHTKKEIKVATKNGYIKLLELQLPGKKKMKTQDVLNGLEIDNSARML